MCFVVAVLGVGSKAGLGWGREYGWCLMCSFGFGSNGFFFSCVLWLLYCMGMFWLWGRLQ